VIKIQDALFDNPFLSNQEITSFVVLFDEVIRENVHFHRLRKLKYIHGLLKYPERWNLNLDLFGFIKPELLQQLKNKEIFFIFDASTEGFSPLFETPFFEILYNNCQLHSVDPKQIIFVSSNLLDEENINRFCQQRNIKEKLNVFSFVGFEYSINHRHGFISTETYLKEKIKIVSNTFKDKYFSSLSRLNRPHRTLATFLLCQESISNKALISHDVVTREYVKYLLQDYDQHKVESWINQLPLVVDRKDFNINWALDSDYSHIHNQTLFQIVNETESHNKYDSALFYSEKTFRPVSELQPFIIHGQQNANKSLKSIGYKTYDDWFDYSWDSEPSDIIRYKQLLESVKDLCSRLDSMTREQKIEWRFKNSEVLVENYNILFHKRFSKNKMFQFLSELIKAQSK
jgi:hypothetical protein